MRTREEHLEFCKKRALEYLRAGELDNAVTSMASDMGKHPETKCSDVLAILGISLVVNHDAAGVLRWIEGFR